MSGLPESKKTDHKTWLAVICCLFPLAIYLWRAYALRAWVVDDAAISYSFARNLAHCYGLVHQQGMPPVEGFSNPLWVMLLSPFFAIGQFDPYWTPKIVSTVLVGITYWQIWRTVRLCQLPPIVALVISSMLSLNTSFVVWTSSGLENALYACLVAILVAACIREITSETRTSGRPLLTGLVAAGVALTRPEGIVFAAAFPISLVLRHFSRTEKELSLRAAIYAAALAIVYGAYLIFRRLYFGDWMPNTYYVKGGPSIDDIRLAAVLYGPFWTKWRDLVSSLLGQKWWIGSWVVLISSLLIPFMLKPRRPAIALVGLLCFLSGYTYLIMTPDYMREFRFATPFFLLATVSMVSTVSALSIYLISSRTVRFVVGSIVVAVIGWQTWREHTPRLNDYAKWPAVSFRRIASEYGTRYDEFARRLGIDSASVLLPDIGGPLYYSELRVYDLAGLCNSSIAKLRGIDQPAFYTYVFDTARPTFIHTHGYFSYVSRLERDPRFVRDYVGIADSLEVYGGDSVILGDWVRREALGGNDSVLRLLSDSLRSIDP